MSLLEHLAAYWRTSLPVPTSPGTVKMSQGTVDERSDIFSIGVMVVEGLTGKRPFGGATYHALLNNILHKPFFLGDRARQGRWIDDIVQKCLAKDPALRYCSVLKIQQDLIPAILSYAPSSRHCPEPEAETEIGYR